MSPRIHLVRHAQGLHNVSAANSALLDPALTAYGRRQCAKVAGTWPAENSIALLAASPLRRTLDTARLCFPKHRGPFVAVPDAQEVGEWPCDCGSPLMVLEKDFEPLGVDLHLVKEGWEVKKGRNSRGTEAIQHRARDLRQWLRRKSHEFKDEGDVVLVTHGGFLHFLTQDWTDYDRFTGTGWTNTEWRTYQFLDLDDPEARMMETTESKARRGMMPKPDRTKYVKLQKKKAAQHQEAVRTNISAKHLPNAPTELTVTEAKHPKI
jgi:broad specificity phosphatase PhoE